MNLVRLLTVLILLPVTALSAVPHVACRCSNGEVHLSCPRMAQPQPASDAKSCCNTLQTTGRKSCCGSNQCGGSSNRKLPAPHSSCSAAGCHCTPVYLTADVGPKLTKVCVPDLVQLELADLSATAAIVMHVAHKDLSRIDFTPEPVDLILLYERFLI